MNLYLIVFLLLGAGSLIEWFAPQHRKNVYRICWTLLTALLVFRFGQGTDYITYDTLYYSIPNVVDIPHAYFFGVSPNEIGWRVLTLGCRLIGIPFWVFAMVLAFVEMLILNRFLEHHLNGSKTTGLFLSFPVLILVYMVSGLRQGLAMCLFLGFALDYYLNRKWGRYILTVLFASLFHMVSLIWLGLILVYYIPLIVMLIFSGLSIAGSMVLMIPAVQQLIVEKLPIHYVVQFFEEASISYLAIGERLASAFVILTLYWFIGRKRAGHIRTELVLKAYLCSICFYMALMLNSYYAGRFSCAFKILECVLIVDLLAEKKTLQKCAALFFFGLTLLMGVKNLNAMIYEGGYDMEKVHVWNFPYISVFNKDAINDYYNYQEEWDRIFWWSDQSQEIWMLGEDDYLCDWKFWKR